GAGDRIEGEQRITDLALFASAEWKATDAITLRPGLRAAHNSRYAAPVVPSLNVRWSFADRFVARASYAEGFRAPSLKERHLFFVDVNHAITGNPGLRAERSRSGMAGMSYRHAKDRVVYTSEINAFFNDVRDLIALARREGASFTYANIGRMRTAGGSAGAGWDNGHWQVSVGWAVTIRQDALAGGALADWAATPELRGSIARQWMRQGWTAAMFWKHQGAQPAYAIGPDGGIQRGRIAAFYLADATITKQLWAKRLALSAGCKDLFNVRNLPAALNGGVHDGGAGVVPMTTGRTFFLRAEIELKQRS
ncbi:MAG: TonB-dependent receptor plug domain-containing protein, partial [Flavobacteriales bacterium]